MLMFFPCHTPLLLENHSIFIDTAEQVDDDPYNMLVQNLQRALVIILYSSTRLFSHAQFEAMAISCSRRKRCNLSPPIMVHQHISINIKAEDIAAWTNKSSCSISRRSRPQLRSQQGY